MRFVVLLILLLVANPASAVTTDWLTIGDPGNACDPQTHGCFGAVPYTYRISKYETTNAQYVEFLNAVAMSDPNSLYNVNMETDTAFGGITRFGSPGSYSYETKPGFESKPVVYVSWYDSIRFANWLNNGQGNGSTETGAYTITQAGIVANAITRNSDAIVFLLTEDEWYKAAYYDPALVSFFNYPAGSNAPTSCVLPSADAGNSANCWPATAPAPGALTDIGAYGLSKSPSGTYDQGGNVVEWVENIPAGSIEPPGSPLRGGRGGGWNLDASYLATSNLNDGGLPTDEDRFIGIRVGSVVPEPSTALLVGLGLALLHTSQYWRER